MTAMESANDTGSSTHDGMDIVVLGQQNWDVTWTGKQQLTTRLAQRGHRVLYVDPDSHYAAGLDVRMRSLLARPAAGELRREAPGQLWVLSLRQGMRDFDRLRRPSAVARVARRSGFRRPAVLTLHPGSLPTVRALQPSGIVYYAVDEWTGFFDDPEAARGIRAQEEAMLHAADVAIGVSPRLQRRFAALQPDAHLQTGGVDVEQFGPERLARLQTHAAIDALPHPRLGLIGQIDRRIDQPLLHLLADHHPEWQIVLVGRVREEIDFSALRARPNVHFLPFQPHAQLPQVLRGLDVCLVPYVLTPLTQSCNPLKAYEYLATGLPIVATRLEGLGEVLDGVSIADTPEQFAHAVELALADPGRGRGERLRLAAGQSWERRTDALEARLREAVAKRVGR